jgi:hypothetical protein
MACNRPFVPPPWRVSLPSLAHLAPQIAIAHRPAGLTKDRACRVGAILTAPVDAPGTEGRRLGLLSGHPPASILALLQDHQRQDHHGRQNGQGFKHRLSVHRTIGRCCTL